MRQPKAVFRGMIADTGGEWQLHKRHHTFSMIADWLFHPFRHLEGGHGAMHGGAADGMVNRMIFIHAETQDDLPPDTGWGRVPTPIF